MELEAVHLRVGGIRDVEISTSAIWFIYDSIWHTADWSRKELNSHRSAVQHSRIRIFSLEFASFDIVYFTEPYINQSGTRRVDYHVIADP